MRRPAIWRSVAALIALLMISVSFASAESGDDSDTYFTKAIARLKSFDAEKYAHDRAAAHDFRLVVVSGVWSEDEVPGLSCTDQPADQRNLFFSDVFYGPMDTKYRDELRKVATRFNRTLASDPAFPGKDICFQVAKPADTTELAILALARPRPEVVDLATAVRAQDIERIRKFIASGADLNADDDWKRTPLMWAARRRNAEIVRQLLDAGAFSDKRVGWNAPLEIAIASGSADAAREILKAGPSGAMPVRMTWNDYSNAPITTAASLGRTDLVQLLIDHHAVPAAGDGGTWSVPLNAAAADECLGCLQLMLSAAGPAIGQTAEFQQLISDQARKRPSQVLTTLVAANVADISYSKVHQAALEAAVRGASPSALKALLESGQDTNLLSPAESDELSKASSTGNAAVLARLLERSATRRRSIDKAVEKQDMAAIRSSLPPGATLEQDLTFTPLMLAAKTASPAILETLLDLGAKIEAHTSKLSNGPGLEGETPLYHALEAANLPATRTLLAHGANIEGHDSFMPWPQLTGIGRFFENKPLAVQMEFVELLLADATPDVRQKRLNEMLASSTAWKRNDLTRALLDQGAESCAAINYYNKPVVLAAGGGNLEIFKLVLQHCPSWSPVSGEARAAVKEVLEKIRMSYREDLSGHLAILRYLLDRKAPLPAPETGNTALMGAVSSGNIEVVGMLLDAGADINEVLEYRTALDWASYQRNNDRMIAYLRSRGAKTAEELGIKIEKVPEGLPF